jgi:release factor glutamine methyltransferase
MTIQSALKEGQSILFYAEVDTPMLDSTVLLAEVLGITREILFASLTDQIDDKTFHTYSLEFYVDERVLVPRPDTEILVDVVLSLLDRYPGTMTTSHKTTIGTQRMLNTTLGKQQLGLNRKLSTTLEKQQLGLNRKLSTLHDACTGSGCIAISLKSIKPGLTITASDLYPGAGEVFRINSRNILDSEIPFYCSDLLHDITGRFDIVTANPPYLSDKEVDDMKKIGWPEPAAALRGGPAGISVSELLIREAPEKINPGGFLVMESSPVHMNELRRIMAASGFTDVFVEKDLGARDRVIIGRIPWEK